MNQSTLHTHPSCQAACGWAGSGLLAGMGMHRITDVDAGPVVQLQVVALVQHDGRDALPAEDPDAPAHLRQPCEPCCPLRGKGK